MNYGMRVKIYFADGRSLQLNNVTEIHYNYFRKHQTQKLRIAFESNIHGTGMTFGMNDDDDDEERVIEFEAMEQGMKTKSFSEVPNHMKQCWELEILDQEVERRR